MPKFNPGDLVEKITSPRYQMKVVKITPTHYMLEVIKHYKSGSTLPIGSVTDDLITTIDTKYHLTAKITSSKFQKGQMIYVTAMPGFEIEVINADVQFSLYDIKYVKTPASQAYLQGRTITADFAAIDAQCELIKTQGVSMSQVMGHGPAKRFGFGDAVAKAEEIKSKTCTCDSRTLFNSGCLCGAVKRYKPKWN